MNENIKSIIKEIDDLIGSVSKNGEELSQEVIDTLEEIANDLSLIKDKKKSKNAQDLVDKLDKLIQTTSNNEGVSKETARSIVSAIEKIRIETPAPQVNVKPPEVNVTVPQIKAPTVNIPETVVNFPDEIRVKEPSWISRIFPVSKLLEKIEELKMAVVKFNLPTKARDAIAVRLSDGEKFYKAMGGIASAITSAVPFTKSDGMDYPALLDNDRHQQVDVLTMPDVTVNTGDIEIGAVEIKNSTDDTRATVTSKGLAVFDETTNSLCPAVYDYISLSYTGSNLTGVVFKTGGSTGTTVSTLTLGHDGSDQLTSVTKT